MHTGSEELYGIFIDGDNMNPKYYPYIDDMIRKRGRILMKHVYCDFTEDNNKAWKKTCLEYGLDGIIAWRTQSKNSSDMKMVTDLMEILQKTPDITDFVIVTGDIDFKEICKKIISYNKRVIGVSCFHSSTSSTLKCFCSEFIVLENLHNLKPTTTATALPEPLPSTELNSVEDVVEMMREICVQSDVEQMNMGLLKKRLLNINPCFNEHNYGHKTFKDFIKMCEPKVLLHQDNKGNYIVCLPPCTLRYPPPPLK